MEKYSHIRESVARHARAGFAAGLFAGTSGNLSARAGDGVVAITPSGLRYEAMTAEDIVLVGPGGRVLAASPGLRPSSEAPMHLEIYRARGDIRAIVHTHSPYATAFAAGRTAIPCALIEMAFFLGGDVRVAPLALPGTAEVGLGAVAALSGRGACLLANHGVVAVGDSLEQAYIRAEYTEDAAKICALARQNGSLAELEADVLAKMLGT